MNGYMVRDKAPHHCSLTDDTLCPCVFYEFYERDSKSISFIVKDKSFIGCTDIKQIFEGKDGLLKMAF